VDRSVVFSLEKLFSPQRPVTILSVFYQLPLLLLPCIAEGFWCIKLCSKLYYG